MNPLVKSLHNWWQSMSIQRFLFYVKKYCETYSNLFRNDLPLASTESIYYIFWLLLFCCPSPIKNETSWKFIYRNHSNICQRIIIQPHVLVMIIITYVIKPLKCSIISVCPFIVHYYGQWHFQDVRKYKTTLTSL